MARASRNLPDCFVCDSNDKVNARHLVLNFNVACYLSCGVCPPQAGPQSGYGGNWNWNMPQNGPTAQGGPPGPTQGGPPGPQGDMYSRGAAPGPTAPAGPGPAAPGAAAAAKTGGSDYGGYGAYSYGQDSGSYGAGRSYGGDVSNQAGAGYSAHPPVPGGKGFDFKEWPAS
uniref:Uncharacterized protein n=1 Tax=Timema bartmani TaxID=61472 RepID=A0A7R9I1P5_9NEOP|nr:unnamed protein product [Timema bartmani]